MNRFGILVYEMENLEVELYLQASVLKSGICDFANLWIHARLGDRLR